MPPSKRVRQETCGHGRCNGSQERTQLDHAISPGKFPLRKQFGEKAVFRRPEQRALRADQENRRRFHRKIAEGEGQQRKKHDADFKKLRADRDRPLAVAVSQEPAGERK